MLERVGNRVASLLEKVLGVAFIIAVLLNAANVAGRYLFNHSLIGAEELQTYIMVFITFLGAALVAWRRVSLRMDVLVRYMPESMQSVRSWIESILMVVCCGFTALQSGQYALQMYELGIRSDGAGVPMWIPHGAIALGLVLICVVTVVHAVQRITGRAFVPAQRVVH
ncbi:TRAP-type C4-dicarboxylate transport system, small permease component [Noviherbaspirillum humi]|uniref:TRAP transporter small permease protein n=1 Tax=Noviherbaspirillum humi TaxID=1688639 RepID=A0A239LCK9_9BURK|nr:TRAP transporter small permease [Noviherbaspirillum humi]SNT27369.1 TRAP-type C4-dicarboxylate transport system, small permease component [Noviherbaspirillum humi]